MSDPKNLGRYQIEAFLGRGAFAEVYKAKDTVLKRTVALKVLKPALMADEEAFTRFTHEAQVLASLVHPRIAWVWDMGEADGRYFIAMRYVDGRSLEKVISERGALALGEVLMIASQVAEALDFAHGQDLVHRDVKPQNIIISEKEGAVLTDFGLVKAMQSSGMTGTGSHLGTPQYMAPELWDGKEASLASDQYALACLVAEMLTGKMLFDGSTPVVIRKHLMEEPVLPSGLPEKVVEGLRRALSKNPEQRHESIRAFVLAMNANELELKSPAQESLKRNAGEDRNEIKVEIVKKKIKSSTRKNENEIFFKLANDVEISFVRIPAGEFIMGEGAYFGLGSGVPEHKVFLQEFWMAKTPVTNDQYRSFMTAVGEAAHKNWTGGKTLKGKEEHPVINVTWDDAVAFCGWVSQVTEKIIRLPSEAEWEKTARGEGGRIYPWGDQKPDQNRCNFNNNMGGTTKVGSFSPYGDSSFGCADMAGNVWEWTSSLHQQYPYNSLDGREVASSRKKRVLRGGSWSGNDDDVRAMTRNWNEPTYFDSYFGFRCCLEA